MPRTRGRHARPEQRRTPYADALRIPAYRALFTADTLSNTGDQIARIALALLVFARTDSPALTAASYAVTYLPWLIGGPLLSSLADRYPRRTVMVVCDLLRAGLVGAMAVPRMPLAALFGLVLVVTLLECPFRSAKSAMLPDLLGDASYAAGLSLNTAMVHVTQVAGFGAGGALVALVTPRGALLIDAVTFLFSAALIVRLPRGEPLSKAAGRLRLLADAGSGARLVFGNPTTRYITLVAWTVAGFAAAPEGLAVVYTHAHGGGSAAAGLMTAALPTGMAIGALGLTRWLSTSARRRALLPLAAAQSLLVAATFANPPLAVAGALWILAGFGAACLIPANEWFVAVVPPERRAAAFGVTGTGVFAAQGLVVAITGGIAESLPIATVIGIAGATGLATTVAIAVAWRARRLQTGTSTAQVLEAA